VITKKSSAPPLASLSNLAHCLGGQGKFGEAELMHRDVIIAFSNHLLIKVADIFVKGRKKFLDTLQTMPEEARSRIPQEMSGPSQHVSARSEASLEWREASFKVAAARPGSIPLINRERHNQLINYAVT
jgi:hypothetical protein